MKNEKMVTIPLKEYLLLRTYKFGYQLIRLSAKVHQRLRRQQKRNVDAVPEPSEYPL